MNMIEILVFIFTQQEVIMKFGLIQRVMILLYLVQQQLVIQP